MLPSYKLRQTYEREEEIELIGAPTADSYRGQKWIGENWIGYLGHTGEAPIRGHWFSSGVDWKFVTKDKKALAFADKEPLIYDGYWSERVYIVLANLKWKKDELLLSPQEDHEHCGICWATLSSLDTCFHSDENDIVCPNCYDTYVVPRSIEFIKILINEIL